MFVFRRATEADIPQLSQIYGDFLIQPMLQSWAAEFVQQSYGEFFVIADGSRLLGFRHGRLLPVHAAEPDKRVFHVKSVYMRPEMRKSGLMSATGLAMKQRLLAAGVTHILSEVLPGNSTMQNILQRRGRVPVRMSSLGHEIYETKLTPESLAQDQARGPYPPLKVAPCVAQALQCAL